MFACTPGDLEWLRTKWQALIEPTTRTARARAASDAAWGLLIAHCSEPHRAYHNLSHVMALLRLAEAMREHISDPAIVEFAIWFHDAIYDTHANDNEERSAALARDAMQKMGMDGGLIAAVESCILATRTHELIPGVADLPLFLDLDLAILGAPDMVYRQYSASIRAEYDWVPEPVYRVRRGAVLKRFAGRARLFFTPPMAARFEAQARRNLEREIRELSLS